MPSQPYATMPDTELLHRAREGEEKAREEFVRRFEPRVRPEFEKRGTDRARISERTRMLLLRVLGSLSAAEKAEAMLVAFEKRLEATLAEALAEAPKDVPSEPGTRDTARLSNDFISFRLAERDISKPAIPSRIGPVPAVPKSKSMSAPDDRNPEAPPVSRRMAELRRKYGISDDEASIAEEFLLELNLYRLDATTHARPYRSNIARLEPQIRGSERLSRGLERELGELVALDERLKNLLRERLQRWKEAEPALTLEEYIDRTEVSSRNEKIPLGYWWYHPVRNGVITADELAEVFQVGKPVVGRYLAKHLE